MRTPVSSFFNTTANKSKKPTFGEVRTEKLATQLKRALSERRTLARAEAAASDPVKTTYRHRSTLAERKIDRITAELSYTKK